MSRRPRQRTSATPPGPSRRRVPSRAPSPAPRLRPARFFALLIVLNIVLLWPWPGMGGAYSAGLARACNATFAMFTWDAGVTRPDGVVCRGLLGSTGQAMIISDYANQQRLDLFVCVINTLKPPPHLESPRAEQTNSWYLGYVPTAMTLAWILATPLRWWRRVVAALYGLVLVHAFIAVRLAMFLVLMFDGTDRHCLFVLPEWVHWLVELAHHILAESLPSSWLAPVVFWIIICVRRRTLSAWFGLRHDQPDAAGEEQPATRPPT